MANYWASLQLIGRDFSENIPGVASLALAVGLLAGWLGHEASSKRKHTKTLPTTCRDAQYDQAGGAISGWIDVRSVPAREVTLQNLFVATMKDNLNLDVSRYFKAHENCSVV